MNDKIPAFQLASVIKGVVANAQTIVQNDTGKIGLAIFLALFGLHIAQGAAELMLQPRSCRFVQPGWYARMILVGAIVGGYGPMAGKAMVAVQPAMSNFTTKWAEVFLTETEAIYEKLSKFLDQYCSKNGITTVFDARRLQETGVVVYAAPMANVTKDFVTEYNKANPAPSK